jgi:hypothetical protein
MRGSKTYEGEEGNYLKTLLSFPSGARKTSRGGLRSKIPRSPNMP